MAYCSVGQDSNGNEIELYYVDYGSGDPVVLIHGWPLSHRMWESQILALVSAGHRVIAYDRRGFGRSSQPWEGYDYDTFAADLKKLLDHVGVAKADLVGFSMGGGEVARFIGTNGTEQVGKAVLMSAVTPYMSRSDDNPDGVDPSVFEGMLDGLTKNRPDFLQGFIKNFYNFDDGTSPLTQANIDFDWSIAVEASPNATLGCVRAFASTDFRADLQKFDVPTLVLHGDDDRIVPFEVSGQKAQEQVEGSELVIIKGGPHGITASHADQVNQALIEFLKS